MLTIYDCRHKMYVLKLYELWLLIFKSLHSYFLFFDNFDSLFSLRRLSFPVPNTRFSHILVTDFRQFFTVLFSFFVFYLSLALYMEFYYSIFSTHLNHLALLALILYVRGLLCRPTNSVCVCSPVSQYYISINSS